MSVNPPQALDPVESARAAIRANDFARAAAELDLLESSRRSEPVVLRLRWLIHAADGEWRQCVVVARALRSMLPRNSAVRIALVKSLWRVGSEFQADAELSCAEALFPADPDVQSLRSRREEFLSTAFDGGLDMAKMPVVSRG